MANIQHIEVAAGEDRTLTLNARNADNNPVSLIGKTVGVFIGRDPANYNSAEPLIVLGTTFTTDEARDGLFTINVPAEATRYAGGDYEYVARAYTDGVYSTVCRGRFRIVPTLVTL